MASKESSSSSVELSSEPFFDKHCAICSKSGRHEEAKKTCLDCKQTLCIKCLKDHDKFDIMKGHRIVDKALSVRGLVALPSEMCGHHSGKVVDMLCQQHDRVCCSACIAIHHRLCDDISYVPSISAGTKTSPEIQTVLKDSKAMLGEPQERKKERENDQERLAGERGGSEKKVHEAAERIIECVKDLEEKSLHQIHQKYDEFQKRVDEDIEKISNAIISLENDIKSLQTSTCDNESQLFVIMSGTELNTMMGTSLKREALHFNIDHQIEENIRKIQSLGQLETPFFSSSELGRYKVRHSDDKETCFISGICLMLDGTTLMADCNNEKLKRLDSSYNLVDYCELPAEPANRCCTEPTEVAITLTDQQTVQFVSVTETLTPSRSFHVGKNCLGIAFSRGQLFITCGDVKNGEEPGEVRVYSTDGKFLHNLPQLSTDQPFWSMPFNIALNTTETMVMITDYPHGVVTMKTDSSDVNKNALVGAFNLCAQEQSLWFVNLLFDDDDDDCGNDDDDNHDNDNNDSNTSDAEDGGKDVNEEKRADENVMKKKIPKIIYQVNRDGPILGALLTEDDGINESPTSVCYKKNDDRLIVGFNCDYIKVFQLSRK